VHRILYKAPKREMDFLLWEQLRIHQTLGLSSDQHRSAISSSLELAREFAEGPMAQSYAETDEQEAHLDHQGVVCTPASFPALMRRYREIWGSWQAHADEGRKPLPEIAQNLIIEMLVGSNPSFVTYVGFNGPAQTLLNTYGSDDLRRRYGPALATLSASACLCLTEKAAGSDLNLLSSVCRRQDSGVYHLTGHKWLISAGMHELTDNIYYFVLARTDAEATGMMGLSCFLVPRYRLDAEGRPAIDNGVRCREVVRKMGLRGCANTLLEFGQEVPSEAYLLGETEGRGLQQLMLMMTPARISTGIYALGLAASACETARIYAAQRIQGKKFDQSMSGKATSQPICQHPDVKRMRLDMLSVTTGCRAMIARLGFYQAQLRTMALAPERAQVATDILDILLPIVKAYTSDQAWRVTETAIQTLGGIGYLRDYPVEQNARDCKILSIWEGTNHIQSLFLIRDKLGLCLRNAKLDSLIGEVSATLDVLAGMGGFSRETEHMKAAVSALRGAAEMIGNAVRQGGMNSVPEFSCEFQTGLAEIAVAWQLLDAAGVAQSALAHHVADPDERAYYEEKVEAARYFVRRRLTQSSASLANIARELGYLPQRLPLGQHAARSMPTAQRQRRRFE